MGDIEIYMARFSHIGCSQALYELGKYDEAIEMPGSTSSNRIESILSRCAQVCGPLSKGSGGSDAAKQTISRAILYEEHWVKDNLLDNL